MRRALYNYGAHCHINRPLCLPLGSSCCQHQRYKVHRCSGQSKRQHSSAVAQKTYPHASDFLSSLETSSKRSETPIPGQKAHNVSKVDSLPFEFEFAIEHRDPAHAREVINDLFRDNEIPKDRLLKLCDQFLVNLSTYRSKQISSIRRVFMSALSSSQEFGPESLLHFMISALKAADAEGCLQLFERLKTLYSRSASTDELATILEQSKCVAFAAMVSRNMRAGIQSAQLDSILALLSPFQLVDWETTHETLKYLGFSEEVQNRCSAQCAKLQMQQTKPSSHEQVSIIQRLFVAGRFNVCRNSYDSICRIHSDPGAPFFNVFLAGWIRTNDKVNAQKVFQDMASHNHRPTATVWSEMMHLAAREDSAETIDEIWEQAKSSDGSNESDPLLWSSRISALIKTGRVQRGLQAFSEMQSPPLRIRPTTETFNTIIRALVENSKFDLALVIFERMKKAGFPPDNESYNSVLSAVIYQRDFKKTHHFLNEMTTKGFKIDVVTYTTLLDQISRSHGHNGTEMVNQMLDSMHTFGLPLVQATFEGILSILSGSTENEAPGLGRPENLSPKRSFGHSMNATAAIAVFDRLRHTQVAPTAVMYSSMLKIYTSQHDGGYDKALEMFEKLRQDNDALDRKVWLSFIYGLCDSGRLGEAIDIFNDMRASRTKPLQDSYLQIAASCVSRKKLRQAEYILWSMTRGISGIQRSNDLDTVLRRLVAAGGNVPEPLHQCFRHE